MSNRIPPSHRTYPSKTSPRRCEGSYERDRERERDRDRPRGYDRDRRDQRSRSRSPRRDRHDERDRREREYDRPRGGEGPRGPREREPADRYDSRRSRDDESRYRRGSREQEERYERDRPLDRRAVEEGRRRREEERAKGMVPDESKAVPTGPRRGVTAKREDEGIASGTASPYPSIRDEDGEISGHARRRDGENGDDPDVEEETQDGIASMMGFGGFGTTKGKSVGPNADGAVQVHKQRTWRQYMNRRGGFNRPLEKMK